MPRTRRKRISQGEGSFHVISRTTRNDIMFTNGEKEYFLKIFETMAASFFVDIHAFCIMGNHFHILATELKSEAEEAEVEELYCRYRLMYGKNAKPPTGSYRSDGHLITDEDGGIDRLRRRLGSLSRFVQELKQAYSRWYNNQNNRRGYLWNERFKGVLIEKGDAQLVCSTYIDLNPVRANIVERPEDYRWSGMGLAVRNPRRARQLINGISGSVFQNDTNAPASDFNSGSNEVDQASWYREFVYMAGGVSSERKGKIAPEFFSDVIKCHGRLGIGDRFKFRVKNMTEGIAIGGSSFISGLQKKYRRKFIRPRSFLNGNRLFTTRVLRL